jgi:hypothetical protein
VTNWYLPIFKNVCRPVIENRRRRAEIFRPPQPPTGRIQHLYAVETQCMFPFQNTSTLLEFHLKDARRAPPSTRIHRRSTELPKTSSTIAIVLMFPVAKFQVKSSYKTTNFTRVLYKPSSTPLSFPKSHLQ